MGGARSSRLFSAPRACSAAYPSSASPSANSTTTTAASAHSPMSAAPTTAITINVLMPRPRDRHSSSMA